MTVRDTSAEAHRLLPADNTRRIVAYVRTLGRHGATRREIADALGIEISSVAGRVNETLGLLRYSPLIETTETRTGRTGRRGYVLVHVDHAPNTQTGFDWRVA